MKRIFFFDHVSRIYVKLFLLNRLFLLDLKTILDFFFFFHLNSVRDFLFCIVSFILCLFFPLVGQLSFFFLFEVKQGKTILYFLTLKWCLAWHWNERKLERKLLFEVHHNALLLLFFWTGVCIFRI